MTRTLGQVLYEVMSNSCDWTVPWERNSGMIQNEYERDALDLMAQPEFLEAMAKDPRVQALVWPEEPTEAMRAAALHCSVPFHAYRAMRAAALGNPEQEG